MVALHNVCNKKNAVLFALTNVFLFYYFNDKGYLYSFSSSLWWIFKIGNSTNTFSRIYNNIITFWSSILYYGWSSWCVSNISSWTSLHDIQIVIDDNSFPLQGYQFYMAVFFWYSVQLHVTSVIHFLQGTRTTRPCLSGWVVPLNSIVYRDWFFLYYTIEYNRTVRGEVQQTQIEEGGIVGKVEVFFFHKGTN